MASADAGPPEPCNQECSICNELFKIPKVLPCGHLLCHKCLLTLMKKQHKARCPLCQDVIVKSSDQQPESLEDVVSRFPTDLAMELAIEADRVLNKQHNCCVCEDVAATSMCLTCNDMLCQPCKKAHGKLSSTKHHTVEDLSKLTAEKLAANQSSPCSSHPEETARLFCSTHKECICFLCATSKHRNCSEVKEQGEKTEESKALLKQLTTRLTEGEADLNKAIDKLDQHLNDTEKYAEAAISEIQEMNDELVAMVNENCSRLKEQVVNTRSDVREAVKEGRNTLLQRQTKLTTHRHVTERVEGTRNHQVVTAMSQTMEKHVDNLDFRTTLPDDAKAVSTFKFVKNSEAVAQIKQELAKLGDVKVMTAKVKVNKVDFVFHDNHGTAVTLSNNNRTASKSNDIRNGIVLSRDPLDINVLYEVHIDKWESGRGIYFGYDSMPVGVTTVSPDSLALALWSGRMTWPAWICPSCTVCSGVRDDNNEVGAALHDLRENHRVGLALDSAHCLHLYVDGQDQGIAACGLTDPCYAMFDVLDYYEQITALPPTRLGL
ncbi:uncharacterized protein LOC143286987 isoform X1 [Babylonia areolata]|uniref:uncharacterized protein LOC143286987 isoform X1 n=1 Tax=Babylonia areolata TaxID=304850 RepID=UPI003FCFE353